MSGVTVTAGTGVHSDASTFLNREPGQREIIQIDKAVKKVPGRIYLDSEPPFSEIDLNLVGALSQAIADLGFVLAQ